MSESTAESIVRRYVKQPWRDLIRIYYTNTPVWRWLKSGALVVLGFCLWTGGNVLLSVQPDWTFLHYVMSYGLVVVVWGPLTHFVIVPLTIRLRRTAEHPAVRWLAKKSGQIQFSLFLLVVVVVGAAAPGIMFLDFSVSIEGGGTAVGGELTCETADGLVSCHVADPQGIDHVVVTSGGETLATVEEEPFAFELDTDDIAETRTGKEFRVDYRNADGDTVYRQVEHVG